jgi:anti-sigma B factor antagonist
MADTQGATPAADRLAVTTLPTEIEVTNALRLGGELGSALASGATVVIADGTDTTFCHSAGARILVLACEQAAWDGIELWLVVRSHAVLAALILAGLDGLRPVYPSLDAALAADPAR